MWEMSLLSGHTILFASTALFLCSSLTLGLWAFSRSRIHYSLLFQTPQAGRLGRNHADNIYICDLTYSSGITSWSLMTENFPEKKKVNSIDIE